MGWSYAEHEDVFSRDWPQLRAIPQSADLLETTAYDEPAVELLVELSQRRGISISNATKLLHQKRPALIPILDSYARLSMEVFWIRGSGRKADATAYRLGFERCRETVDYERNKEALREAQAWLGRPESPYRGLSFTLLRLLDIVAWMKVSSPNGSLSKS